MIDRALAELIDDFLLGHLQGDRLDRFIELRNSDPEFDIEVRQSIEAFRVLQYGRYKELRKKLHQIDELSITPKKRSFFTPWMLAFILIIFIFFGTWRWFAEYYSPSSLALRFFQDVPAFLIGKEMINNPEAQKWELACTSFKEKDFHSARHLFQPYANHQENQLSRYAQWNILLARLGEEGPTIKWREELKQFEINASEPFNAKAHKLLGITDSAFYRFFVLHLSLQLSAFKPQLM